MDAPNFADNSGWWFALSLVNAGLAETKGRSRFAWWLASLLLGPIATFLIVVMAPVPKTDPQLAAEQRSAS